MNRAMNEDRLDAYQTPDQVNLVAQYFLLYSASGDPTDFEEEIDYDYRQANLRATLNTGRFTHGKVVMEAAEQYVNDAFSTADLTATLTGRVSVDYHWIRELAQSHFRSVGIALAAVWLVATLSFGSALAGLLALVPVAMAILLIYAIMGFFGIWLAIGTSMFAAIAIGIGVDFSVHTIDRLKVLIKEQGRSMEDAFSALFPSTGRALLFNFAAILLGFGVLTTSQVPPLVRFGSLVGVAVSVSFVASMTLLPALIKVLQPSFLKSSGTGS
jgi:predicted RND superfamily exporter protein